MTDEELALLALETGREAAELLLAGWSDVQPVATKSTGTTWSRRWTAAANG